VRIELSKVRHANRRRHSAMMYRLAFVVPSLSPACYRLLRLVLSLPRADWIRVTQEERSAEIEGAMTRLTEVRRSWSTTGSVIASPVAAVRR
jgi:hypothetical protein